MDGQTGEQIRRVFGGMGGLKNGECFRLGFAGGGAPGKPSEPSKGIWTGKHTFTGPGNAGRVLLVYTNKRENPLTVCLFVTYGRTNGRTNLTFFGGWGFERRRVS